ncbi:MAG: ABC transporter ATP-binding protein [Calditrichaeota bacterium]|nr:ABC transporter ATP-binding protein [Calditrichota bacterium]
MTRPLKNSSDPKKRPKLSLPMVKYAFHTIVWPRRWRMFGGLIFISINRAAGLVLPGSSKYLLDEIIGNNRPDMLFWLVAAVAGAELLKAGTSISLIYLLRIEAQHLIKQLRERMQQHIIYLKSRFFDEHSSGSLVSRIMSDVDGVRFLVGTGLVNFIGSIITAVLAFVVLIRLNAALTFYTLAPMALAGIVVWRMVRFLRPTFRERRKINAEVSGRLTESLGGIRIIKAFNAEPAEINVFSDGTGRIFQNVRKTILGFGYGELLMSILMSIVGLVVMGMGGSSILAGEMTLGDFVAFSLFLVYLIGPIAQLAGISNEITDAFAGLDRMEEILNIEPEGSEPERTVELGNIQGNVDFHNVCFSYEKDVEVIKNMSFSAPAGTVTALVGPSGSGKSTMAGLVSAFLTPDSGTVTVDGIDLSTVKLPSYRSNLGVVLQDDFLFEGTIRENIRFGNPDASDAQLNDAVKAAHVLEFVERFEKGLDTIVGERGVKLSGGQRQRVAIARAILADPKILILDEATSNLDAESEAVIQDSLANLMRGRTTFVIAHRLSTIRSADQILVIDGGEIVERGAHDELMQNENRYFQLYTRQARI